jgi:flavoprotein
MFDNIDPDTAQSFVQLYLSRARTRPERPESEARGFTTTGVDNTEACSVLSIMKYSQLTIREKAQTQIAQRCRYSGTCTHCVPTKIIKDKTSHKLRISKIQNQPNYKLMTTSSY